MPHIDLREGLPGITSAFAFRPETAAPMRALAETLLRGPSTLTSDGLATFTPTDPKLFDDMGARMAHQGYAAR